MIGYLAAMASCFAALGSNLGPLEITSTGPDMVTIERHVRWRYTRSVTLNARPVASGGPICLSSGDELGITHDWDEAREWMEVHLR